MMSAVQKEAPCEGGDSNEPEGIMITPRRIAQEDLDQAHRYLTLLDEEAEVWTFQTFTDTKPKPDPDPLALVLVGSFDDHANTLVDLNRRGAGIFVTVNETDGKGRKKKNISRIRAVFQEADRGGEPELPVDPHIVVESSPGKHHRYVLVDGMPVDSFEPVQERLVREYGSDPNAKDRSRVLRLPGFFHRKDPDHPHLVRVVQESGAQPLPWAKVESLFPPVPHERKKPIPKGKAPPNMEEIRSALFALDPDMEYDPWLSVLMAVHSAAPGTAGVELADEWSATGSKYSQGCVETKWRTFSQEGGTTIATLFGMAHEAGWEWRGGEDLTDTVADLAKLTPLEYDRVREARAKALGVRVGTLDKEVAKERAQIAEEQTEHVVEELSPAEDPVDGVQLLGEIERIYRRHCITPEVDYTVLPVLALGTYVFDAFSVYPKVLVKSPEKRCGKTVMLEVSESVVFRGLMASSISTSATFRIIDAHHPTLIIDEADTFLSANEEMRGVINSSHRRRNAYVIRTEKQGDTFETKRFTTWAPIYIAGIGSQADTIEDRSVIIDLRRKLPGESVAKCPVNLFERNKTLRSRCLRWAQDHMDKLRRSDFEVPSCGNDRAADNWFPLMAIVKLIGEPWESRLMAAYVEKNHGGEDEAAGVMLLRDIRQVFMEERKSRMHSEDLVAALVELPDRPWEEWKHGKPMTKTSLSRLLKPYKIKSRQLRIGQTNRYGYEATQFEDAWKRYTHDSQDPPFQNTTSLQPKPHNGFSDFQNATPSELVVFSNPPKPSYDAGCSDVAFPEGGSAGDTCPRCGGEGCSFCDPPF